MGNEIWWAIAAAAIGTVLLRVVPLIWMQRHLNQKSDVNEVEKIPEWLSVLGPMMIASMLGASLVPSHVNAVSVAACIVGTLVTLLVWRLKKSLGWPIFAGVAMYGLVFLLGSYF